MGVPSRVVGESVWVVGAVAGGVGPVVSSVRVVVGVLPSPLVGVLLVVAGGRLVVAAKVGSSELVRLR